MNFSDGRALINAINKEIDKIANNETKSLAKDINIEVREANPVDTGWSKSNWVASVGEPYPDVVSPGSRDNLVGGGSASTAEYNKGLADIDSFDYKDGKNIFITNNTDYIEAVNAGYPTPRHLAFVDLAIDRAIK